MPTDKTIDKGQTDNPEPNLTARTGRKKNFRNNTIPLQPGAIKARQIRQKQQRKRAQGYVTPRTYKVRPTYRKRTASFDARDYTRYLGGEHGWIPNMSKQNLDYFAAQNQPATTVIGSTIIPVLNIPKVGVALVRELGKVEELLETWTGDYTFNNSLMEWADNAERKLRQDGFLGVDTYIKSKYPNEMVGDFRGFMRLIESVETSAATFAIEGMGVGKLASLAGKGIMAATGIANGSKMAANIARVMKGASAFAVTGFESADVGAGAYNRTVNELTNQINPTTGMFYTKDEVAEKAGLTSKRAFWINQTIVSFLNLSGVSTMVMPEVSVQKAVNKQINKQISKNVLLKGGKEGIEDVTEAIIKKQAKRYARNQFGAGRTLLEAGQEGIEETMNTWAEESAVHSVVNNERLLNSMFNKDVLHDTFATKDTFWNFISGAIGGAGQHTIIGHGMPNLKAMNQNEFVVRNNGMPVYANKDITNKQEFLDLPKELQAKIIEQNSKLKTIKRPVKPGPNATEAQKQKYKEEMSYHGEFRKARRKNFWQNRKQQAQKDYIDLFVNKNRVLKNAYTVLNNNINIIQQESIKKNKGEDYDQSRIDKAKNRIFNIASSYNIKNDTGDVIAQMYEMIENLSQKEAMNKGLAENDTDTSYKERAREAKESIKSLSKEYKKLNNKYWDKKNIIGGELVDILFDSHLINHTAEQHKKNQERKVASLIEESTLSRVDAENLLAKFIKNDSIRVGKDKVNFKDHMSKSLNHDILQSAFMNKNSEFFNRLDKKRKEFLNDKIKQTTANIEEKTTKKDVGAWKDNENLMNNLMALFEAEVFADMTLEASSYMRSEKTRKKIHDDLIRQAKEHIENRHQERETEKKQEQERKRKQREEKINKERKKERDADLRKNENEIIKNNQKNLDIKNTVETRFKQISDNVKELKDLKSKDIDSIITEQNNLESLYEAIVASEDKINQEKELIELQEAQKSFMKKILHRKHEINNQTTPESDKNEFSKSTVNELLDIMEELNNTTTLDDDIESDAAINFTSSEEEQRQRDKFRKVLGKLYEEYKNKPNIKISDVNDYRHFVEFYKTFLKLMDNKMAPLAKEMFKLEIMSLMNKAKTSEINQPDIIRKIIDMDAYGEFKISEEEVQQETEKFDYDNNEVKPLTVRKASDNEESVNQANKLLSPHNSVAYLERGYVTITTEGNIIFLDTENVTEGGVQDTLEPGNSITLEVVDQDDIPVSRKDGTKTTWGELKKKFKAKSDSEYYKHVPIVIKKDNKVIGFVHDPWFIENKGRNIAESVDIENELKNLYELREHLYKNKKVSTKIDTIKNGVLNFEQNRTSGLLQDYNPNLDKQGVQLAVYRNGTLQTEKDVIFNGNIINSKFLDDYSPEGSLFILYPNATKTAYFAHLADVPRLDDIAADSQSEDGVVNSILDAIISVARQSTNKKIENLFKNPSEVKEFFNNYVYTKSFNLDTLEDGDKQNYRHFFNVTKKGNIEFAHVDPSLPNSFIKYTIEMFGENRGKISIMKRDLEHPLELLGDTKAEAFDLLRDILSKKYLNINLNHLGKRKKFDTLINIGTKNIKQSFNNYYEFLSNYVKTTVLEKTVENDDGTVDYSYTVQPTIEFNKDFLSKKKHTTSKTSNVKKESVKKDIPKDPFADELEDNEEYEEFDTEDAILYSEESLEKMNKEIIETDTGLSYEEEQDITELLTLNLLKEIKDDSIDKPENVTKYFEQLAEKSQSYLDELYEQRDQIVSEESLLRLNNKLKLHESIINHTDYFKRKVILNITEDLHNKDIEDELLSDEIEETERKPQWDQLNHARDTTEKASLKLKMLLNTIPIAYFKTDENGNIEKVNGKPKIVYRRNTIGTKKMADVKNIEQAMHGILTDYSHVPSKDKFNTFIEALENSGDASLYLVAQKLKQADDKTKAAFVTIASVQDTNSVLARFKTVPVEKLNPITGEPYYELENKVYVFENSWNSMIKKIKDDFYLNAASNVNSNILVKKGNKFTLNIDKLNEYKSRIENKTFNNDDLKVFLNDIGFNFTNKEFNLLLENNKLLYNTFERNIKKVEDLYKLNSVIYYMIEDIISVGGDVDVNVVNPLSNVNKEYISEFAKIKLRNSKRYGVSTFRNGEGNKVQTVTHNHMLSRTLHTLTQRDDNGEFSKELKLLLDPDSVLTGNILYKDGSPSDYYRSYWAKVMKTNKASLFDNGINDVLHKWSAFAKAKSKPNMSPEERFVNSVFLWTNNNKEFWKFAPLAYSDKKTSPFTEVPRFELNVDKYIQDNQLITTSDGFINPKVDSDLLDAIDFYFVRPEIKRINKHIKSINDGVITENNIGSKEFYGGYFFYFEPSLNSIKEIRNQDGSIKTDKESKDIMRSAVLKSIIEDSKLNYNGFEKLFVKINKKNVKRLHLLDTRYVNNKYGTDANIDNVLQHMALEFTFNYRLATVEYSKVIGSYFSSTYKAKGQGALNSENYNKYKNNFINFISDNGSYINNAIEQVYGEYIKRMAKDIAPRMDGYWVDNKGRDFSNFTQMYTSESKSNRYTEHYKKQGVPGYEKVEAADAQECSSTKEYIINAHAYANITDKVYNEMMDGILEIQQENKQIIDRLESEGASHMEVLNAMKSYEIPKHLQTEVSIVNTKPVYAGKKWDQRLGRFTSRYIKVATFTMVPGVTRNTDMDLLRKQAEYIEAKYNTSVRIAMDSGVKEGANDIKNIWNEELKPNNEEIIQLRGEELSREGFGIQLEEPMDEIKISINLVSQANKLLFNGLLTGFDTKDGSIEGFTWNNTLDENGKLIKYSALQLKNLKEDIRKQIVQIQSNKLLDELGLVQGEKNITLKKGIGRKEFMKKLHDVIKKEMRSRNYNVADLNAIELIEGGDEFRFPLDFVPSSEKIEGLLLSIITNRIIKTKMPGKNYVNTAPNGIMSFNKKEEYTNDIVYTTNYKNNGLKYIEFNEDGSIGYAQCFVPFNFTDANGNLLNVNDYVIEKNGKKMLDVGKNGKFDKELLKLVGMRIPNQDKVSMLTLEIAGFLPPYMKNMIVLPPEITKQMGSDNDNDHLYTYSFNTNLSDTTQLYKDIKETAKEEFDYDVYKGTEEYQQAKQEIQKLNIKYSDVNLKELKSTLTDEENKLLDNIENLYDFEKKIYKNLNATEKSLRNKMKTFSAKWRKRQKENKQRIEELTQFLREERIGAMEEDIKAKRQAIKEEKNLRKLSYSSNTKDDNVAQLQNAYVDIFHSVLSNPEIAKTMLSVLDKPYLGDESDMLKSIMEKDKKFDPLSLKYALEAYDNNQTGKIGVAIQSLVSTFLALSEDKNLVLNNEIPIKVKAGNKTVEMTKLGIGDTVLENGESITNSGINMMLQNEAVDNAKNLKLSNVNYNKYTALIYNTLLVMKGENNTSIPMETLTRLMNQEVMLEFTKQIINKSSSIKDIQRLTPDMIFENIKVVMENKYNKMTGEENAIDYDDFVLKSPKQLLSFIEKSAEGKEDSEYYYYQAQLANWLDDIYSTILEPINNLIMNVAGIDSKSIGKNMIEMQDRYKRILESIYGSPGTDPVIPNAENLLETKEGYTELGEIFNRSFNLAHTLYIENDLLGKSLFGYNSGIYNNILNILQKQYKTNLNWTDDKKKVWKGFKQYVMNRSLDKFIDNDLQSERERLLYGNNSLVTRTLNYKSENWFRSNDFLIQLSHDINENKIEQKDDNFNVIGDNPMFLKFDSFIKDRNKDYNNITSLFKLIIDTNRELNNNPVNQELINRLEYLQDLINYTILESGIQNAHNWMKVIHPLYLEEMGLLSELRNYQNDINFKESDMITKQILKHNTDLIRAVRNLNDHDVIDKIKSSETGETLLLKFDSATLNEYIISRKDESSEDLLFLLIEADEEYPGMIRHYNKDTEVMEIYELDTNSLDYDVVYKRVNPLGTSSLGTTEFGPTLKDTVVKENKHISIDEQRELNEGIVVKDEVVADKTALYNKFAKTPSKDTAFDIINELAKQDDEYGVVAKIIQHFPDIYENTIFMNAKSGKRAETLYKRGNYKPFQISIDIENIKNRQDSSQAIDNEFKELLLHEMLHPLYRRLDYRVNNDVASQQEQEIYANLENFRQSVLDKLIKQNPEMWEEYQKQLKEKNDGARLGIDKNLVTMFEAFRNVGEMLSYGWTNSDTQEHMKSVKIGNKVGIDRFLELLGNLLKDIMDKFNIKDSNNSLAKFIELSTSLYTEEVNEINVNKAPIEEGAKNIKQKEQPKQSSLFKSPIIEYIKQNPDKIVQDELGFNVIVKDNKVYDEQGKDITLSYTQQEINEFKLRSELNDDADQAIDYIERLKNIVDNAHKKC